MLFTLFVTAFLAIVSHELGHPAMYILKAVPTLCAFLLLLLLRKEGQTTHSTRFYKLWCAALVFSMAGDLSLLFPNHQIFFLAGMFFFLVTHVLYSMAYVRELRSFNPLHFFLLIPLLLFAAFFFGLLYANLGSFLVPVCIYMSALIAMVWFSFCFALNDHGLTKFQKAAIVNGAFLFLVSDTLLGVQKFLTPLPLPHVLILGTYYLAQSFFVFSFSKKFPAAYFISFRKDSISSMRSAASR